MKLGLFILPRAEVDIDAHCSYLASHDIERAVEFDRSVFVTFERLCEKPLIGRRLEVYNSALMGVRRWFVKDFENYLIFYLVFDNYIEIVRVLHSAQNSRSIIEDERV